MLPRCRPSAALAEEVEEVASAATRSVCWRARPTSVDRESTTNHKYIACERTNVAQLMRGRPMDVSCHADNGKMRIACRRARFDKYDTHTCLLHLAQTSRGRWQPLRKDGCAPVTLPPYLPRGVQAACRIRPVRRRGGADRHHALGPLYMSRMGTACAISQPGRPPHVQRFALCWGMNVG